MTPIIAPLAARMKGAAVANLQEALLWLIDRGALLRDDEAARREYSPGLRRELAAATFDSATSKVTERFQREHHLRPTGSVDGPTADALNARLRELGAFTEVPRPPVPPQPPDVPPEPPDVLPEFMHLVRGQVRYEEGLPIEGLDVEAVHKLLRSEEPLGTAKTDANGQYEIYYSVEELRKKGQSSITLLVRVKGKKDGEDTVSVLAESDVVFEAGIVEKVNLRIPGGVTRTWSDYEQLMSEIEPLLAGAPIVSLTEEGAQRDVSYLSGKLRRDATVVAQLAGAHKLAEKTKVPADVLFGLAQKRLPLKLSELLAQSAKRRRAALTAAVRERIIPGRILNQLDQIEARFQQLSGEHAVESAAAGASTPLGALLDTTPLTKAAQARLVSTFVAKKVPASEFWKELRTDAEIGPHVDSVQLAVALGTLTANHMPLVTHLKGLHDAGQIKGVRDLARFDRDDWKRMALTPDGAGQVSFPAEIDGKTDDDKAARYADVLTSMVEDAFPLESLAHRAQRPASGATADTRMFFRNVLNQDVSFDFGRARIDTLFTDHPGLLADVKDVKELSGQLKAQQRVFKLAPRYEQMKPLLDAGLTSASAISRMGRKAFSARFGSTLGGATAAVQLHAKAGQVTASALNVLANLSPPFALPLNAVPWSPPVMAGVPDWETLFGTFDFCSCGHCRSVHSPAAYLAELLAFLKERQVDVPAAGGGTTSIALRELLYRRRPDLGDIELTCENTNLELPYIDLAAEILENAIRPFTSFALPPGAEADLDTRSLSAAIRTAFTTVGRELPDDARVVVVKAATTWLISDHRRLYDVELRAGLAHVVALGYQTFGTKQDLAANPSHVNAAAYTALADAVHPWSLPFDLFRLEARTWLASTGVDRADLMRAFQPVQASPDPSVVAIATEALGSTAREVAIITGTDSHQAWEFWGLAQSGNAVEIPDPADASKTITASLGWVETLGHVRPFLRQSGLAYDELRQLLSTRFVNPDGTIRIESVDAADPATCDTHKLAIAPLTADVLDRMHRFARLWRRLGWTMRELDLAIEVFQGGVANPNARLVPRFIEQLAATKRAEQALGASRDRLLSLWGRIDTRRGLPDDPAGPESLYERLFLNPTLLKPVDTTFALNTARTGLALTGETVAGHAAAIVAGLGITAEDLTALAGSLPSSTLDLPNLSALLGRVVLAAGLGIPIAELLRWRDIAGIDPFDAAHPEDTVTFIDAVRRITAAGLSAEEVDYLLRHQPASDPSLTPATDAIAVVLGDLRAGLQKIDGDLTIEPDLNGELTRKYLALLKWDPAHIEQVVSALNVSPVFSAPLESLPDATTFPASVQARVAWDANRRRLTFAGILTAADRTALSGVALPAPLQVAYAAAVDDLFAQSNALLDAVRAYERPVFRTPLAQASMPVTSALPRRLRSRLFYDRRASELCFSGLMIAQDRSELAGIPGTDAAFAAAVDQLRLASSGFVPTGANVFLTDATVTAMAAADQSPAQRFQTVLERLVPRLRRLLGESLVRQKISEALSTEPLLLQQLLDTPTLDGFLSPDFVESHATLSVDPLRWPALFESFTRLSKAVLVADRLKLAVRQLEWYFRWLPSVGARDVPWALPASAQAGWLDFRALPIVAGSGPAPVLLAGLLRLVTLREAAQRIRPGGDLAVEEMLSAARDATLTPPLLIDAVAAILKRRGGWDEAGTTFLCGAAGLALSLPGDFQDEVGIDRLTRCQSMARRINAPVDRVRTWAVEHVSEAVPREIKQALRARHGEEAWQQAARPSQDAIREARRLALVAYLAVRPPDVTFADGVVRPAWRDVNGLFAHFLIDVEMTAVWTTSRIKQAISSVQLFVQRCLLNLEIGVRIDVKKDDAWRQWKWMKNYRVWEANRVVFLFPENFIEWRLRDDKTPFYRELENELLQNEITAETAEDAFLHYLEKFANVDRPELMAMYQEDAGDGLQPVLHVFGRTRATPAVYYYRRRAASGRWTPWEMVDLDIEGDHLIPIVWNRRLYVFWPVFTIKAHSKIPTQAEGGSEPSKYFEIQLAWSEYRRGRWLPKKLTTARMTSPVPVGPESNDGRNRHAFFARIDADGLRIWPDWDDLPSVFTDLTFDEYHNVLIIPTWQWTPLGAFFFSGGRSDAVIEYGRTRSGIYNPSHTYVNATRFSEITSVPAPAGGQVPVSHPLLLPMEDTSSREEEALAQTPGVGGFQLLYPHQDQRLSGGRPFFFEEDTRAFYVTSELVPIRRFNWHTDVVDLGQTTVVKTRYYGVAAKSTTPAPSLLTLASTAAATTGMGLSQQDVQAEKYKAAARAAAPWLDTAVMLAPDRLVPVLRRGWRYRFETFHHPFVNEFLKALNKGGVDELLTLEMQESREDEFAARYRPRGLVSPDHPSYTVEFRPKSPQYVYNTEIFLYAPLQIASELSRNQRFEEAQRWFHYVFDPTNASNEEAPGKFWRVKPLHDLQRADYLQQRIEQLLTPTASGGPNPELAVEIDEWRTHPFSPHAIARLRLTAYQKAIVMKYLDNTIAWADQLFSRDTIESINEATQLYILAADLLGPEPTVMAPRAEPQTHTCNSLDPSLAAFSNRLVEIENLVPAPSPDAVVVSAATPALPLPLLPYFCVPKNDKLLGYWRTVKDRLTKIRFGQNIQGVARRLDLFEPAIDPALLVRATAAGVDIGSVLNDMNASLPTYRFQVMAQKATELVADVRSLGAALLSALEKRDAEALALLRSGQEVALLKQVRDVRRQLAREAAQNVAALEQGRAVTEAKRDYYRDIARINAKEQLNLDKLQSAHDWQTKAQVAELVAAIAPLVGDFDIGASGWASSPVVKWKYGGQYVGMAAQATARGFNFLASIDQFEATNASIMGGFDRRFDEWKQQEKLANLELRQADRQIEAGRIRQAVADKELANHDLQIANASAVDELMRAKFSNRDLFDWMVSQVSGLYFQSYQLAYDVARRAERAYRHELGLKDSSFIEFGYWDGLKKGLLAGERLYHDLKRMETSYLDQHKREYEITKHVSLAMLHPQALVSLKESGSCFFELPEAIFDMDHPGHYLRRITSVSLSIPCVAGPYTSVSAKLTLLGNRIRRDPQAKADGSDYAWRGADDPRFAYDVGGIQSIVTSTGREDGGVFELSFRDERYLPFEGPGVVSSWRLQLSSTLRQFDHDTISDVVVHVRYTARDGGEPLKAATTSRLMEALRLMAVEQGKTGLFRLFSLRHDFPDRWHHLLHAAPVGGAPAPVVLEIGSDRFPAYARDKTIRIKSVLLMVKPESPRVYDPLDPIVFAVTRPGSAASAPLEVQSLPGDLSAAAPAALQLGGGVVVHDDEARASWTLALTQVPAAFVKTVNTVDGPVDLLEPSGIQDMAVLCQYTIE